MERSAAAADAAAQLVQLREAEALGMLDHHHGRLRHVDADLDHRGGDQEPRLAGGEARHGAVLLGALHAAVHQVDRVAETLLAASAKRSSAAARSAVLGFLDQRADPIDPLALGERAADRLDHLVERGRAGRCGCRSAGGRRASRAAPRLSMSPK